MHSFFLINKITFLPIIVIIIFNWIQIQNLYTNDSLKKKKNPLNNFSFISLLLSQKSCHKTQEEKNQKILIYQNRTELQWFVRFAKSKGCSALFNKKAFTFFSGILPWFGIPAHPSHVKFLTFFKKKHFFIWVSHDLSSFLSIIVQKWMHQRPSSTSWRWFLNSIGGPIVFLRSFFNFLPTFSCLN